MCALPGTWVVPDFGTVSERRRLTSMMGSEGTRPCIIFGGSGSGKSVVAGCYANSTARPTLWIDASREPLSAHEVAQLISRSIGTFSQADDDCRTESAPGPMQRLAALVAGSPMAQRGITVVVDDLGEPDCPEFGEGFLLLARSLRSHSSQLVLTTRSLDGWTPKDLCEFLLLGPSDTRVTAEEALAVRDLECPSVGDDAVVALCEACSGHIAFLKMLLVQSFKHGLMPSSERMAPLDAWLGRAVQSLLSSDDALALTAAVLLKHGTSSDLKTLGLLGNGASLVRICGVLPLVVLSGQGRTRFRVHDLVDGYFRDHLRLQEWQGGPHLTERVIQLLSDRGDYSRACELMCRLQDSSAALEWFIRHGDDAILSGDHRRLEDLMESIPIGELMGQPRLLLIWADVCSELGRTDDAFSKSRAARQLATHENDFDTTLQAMAKGIVFLRRLGRLDEADALAAEILAMPASRVPGRYRAESMFCLGYDQLVRGEVRTATAHLQAALELAEAAAPSEVRLVIAAKQALALIPALHLGDFAASLRLMTPLFELRGQLRSSRLTVKGNAATCLIEMGRLQRCESLVRYVVNEARELKLPMYVGAYMPVLACVEFALGELAAGIDSLRAAIRYAIEAEDEVSAAQARVYLATILRAAGQLDESLTEAERAFERLSVADTMQFRRLAALEVAASLLALGDRAAARAWAESIAMEGFSGNRYHMLRADLILAEVERCDGPVEDAVARLAGHRDYILSENPNWQCAMYCRAFPGLLGVIAAAIYPEPVPAHLLRMILPEHAEQCLGAARGTLAETEWRALGERLLGAEEFEAYLHRDGLPLCHVRLFGGLEVSIGGRSVREKNWKKRKARLLFAMLAIRRGQDIPRDQLFEYLWPEMDAVRAKNNLYVAWSTMKAALVGEADKGAPCPYIETVGGVCRTVRDAVRTDVDEFETLMVTAREAESANQPSDALRAYERVADLYRGDLLPGDVYDDWFATLRDHYRSGFVDAMLRAAALLMKADDPGNALVYVRRAIQSDPYREDLYQAALRCQIAAGQRSAAIDTYFQCRDNLSEELGLDPSVETRALYDQILAMEDRPRPTPLDPLL